ncbi:hypothetical protein BpHYR1_032215 [Brachionus plicatilis]|uniref:Uncharacterized protein n=1 Tax=Brachionus plicatilis TaxID=10195 RepID=A0A3M7R420_BRAPC|nr:hypothetical protein BpHYR1_032215 [Brachionus plicatilis]
MFYVPIDENFKYNFENALKMYDALTRLNFKIFSIEIKNFFWQLSPRTSRGVTQNIEKKPRARVRVYPRSNGELIPA